MNRRTGRQPIVVAPGSAPVSLPDGWYDVYRWFGRLTSSADAAEELTVEVCRRLRSGRPSWLADDGAGQRRFVVVQVAPERRGVLPERRAG